jgi:hypothetical protein
MARAARKIPEGSWPRLLSAERGAAYLDISLPTFRAMIVPHLIAVSIGSRKLFDRVALDKLIDERTAEDPDWLKGFDR